MEQATQPQLDPLGDLIEEWREWMRVSKGLLPNTVKLYTRTVEDAARQVPDFLQAHTEDLERWIVERGGAASTVSNRISALTSFYRFMVKSKRRKDNPAAEMDKPKRRQGVPKPIADVEAAFRRLDAEDVRANERKPSCKRRVGETRDIATFMLETGLRVSEACSVGIDGPAPDSITIIGKGHKEAIVLLTPLARDCIDRLGGRIAIGTRAIQRRFERADFHPHALRHTFATRLVQKGIEIGTVSKLCRHSSPSVTMVYAQYATDQLRKALEN